MVYMEKMMRLKNRPTELSTPSLLSVKLFSPSFKIPNNYCFKFRVLEAKIGFINGNDLVKSGQVVI